MRMPNTLYKNTRTGSSYLEIQVAMVLLSIGISGLYSLSVVQTRQTTRLEQVLPTDQIASINPVSGGSPIETAWAKKLGVYADIQADAVTLPEPIYPLNDGFLKIVDNEHSSDFMTYQAPGSDDWDSEGGYPADNEMDVEELDTNNSFGSYARFTLSGVQPGDYELLVYCPRQPFFGTAVTHHIYDGATRIDTVAVDQTVTHQDYGHNGRWWQRLGAYTFHNSVVSVVVSDTPVSGATIIADAVMLRCRRSLAVVADVERTTNGGATVTVESN